jgi:hypothetical protein
MSSWKVLAVAAAIGALGATSAQAAVEQDPAARLNQLGSYSGLMPVCEKMGFQTQGDLRRYSEDAAGIGLKAGFSNDLSYTYVMNAQKSAQAVWQQEMQTMVDQEQDDDGKFAVNIRRQVLAWVSSCREIAADPIGRSLVANSASSNEVLAQRAADTFLEPAGWGSWQTPYIRAYGELAYAVGLCSARLTSAESDSYMADFYKPKTFAPAVAGKARIFIAKQLDDGRTNAEQMGLGVTQCSRILTGRAATLKTAAR